MRASFPSRVTGVPAYRGVATRRSAAMASNGAARATLGEGRTIYNEVLGGLPTTVFEKMSLLAAKHKSINLGQGFPDRELEGPASMKDEAYRFMVEESNQYPPMFGLPALRDALAAHSLREQGIALDAQKEVLVTSGATEALAAAFMGLLNPGDRVVAFAPLYDSYVPILRRTGAVPVIVDLLPELGWQPDPAGLTRAFAEGPVAAVVVNTPHNPTGSVLSSASVDAIAKLVDAHNALAILDEVYEHLVFPPLRHESPRLHPLLRDRAVRIGSAGKTFSFTAWKVGWLTGPAKLVKAAASAHQFLTFTVPSQLQSAVAHGLEKEQDFYNALGTTLQAKRARLAEGLETLGFRILDSQATYFLVADYAPLYERKRANKKLSAEQLPTPSDVDFCQELTVDGGVTLIPVSAFYTNPDEAPASFVRFVTSKTDEKLDAAIQAIKAFLEKNEFF